MNRSFNTLVFLCAGLLAAAQLTATTRKVLFIGNSYTYTNSMPTMLQSFAAACGDTLITDMSAPGGYTFQQHTTYAPTLARITAQQWDIVVLQEQSEEPAFPPAQVATDVYPYATRLDSLVHANDTCTQTMFMMTWGRRNGDAANCASYPTICTYAGMQARIRESYLQMTQDNHAVVAPVGAAWKIVRDSFPAIELYMADSTHPSIYGSYLQTCVFYGSVFHRPSLGCTYIAGLPAATALTLQRIADKVVFDSLLQWQQYGHYPYASFTRATTGATATFTGHSLKADDYTWSFGDGHTDTASSPVHTYTTPGVYSVSLTASTNCFTETRKDTIHIGLPTGVNALAGAAYPIVTTQDGNGKVTFAMPAGRYSILEIVDSKGSTTGRYPALTHLISCYLQPGIYLYRAYSTDRSLVYTNKLLVMPK